MALVSGVPCKRYYRGSSTEINRRPIFLVFTNNLKHDNINNEYVIRLLV